MKEFKKMLKKLEEHFGEKAIYLQYKETNPPEDRFEPVPWEEHQDQMYNVYVAGYSAREYGPMILKYDMKKTDSSQVLKWEQGCYGYSHRAGQSFDIGDMLFDEKWEMPEDHPKYEECLKKAKEAKKNEPEWYRGPAENYVMDYLNFKERGAKKIETEEEAYQAALNFAKYVS